MVQLCLEFSPTVRLLRRVRGFREVDEGQEEDHQHQGDRRRKSDQNIREVSHRFLVAQTKVKNDNKNE